MIVETINNFEGTENPLVVMDTVVMDKICFMADPNYVNVRLSHAKWGVWIIYLGKILLGTDDFWASHTGKTARWMCNNGKMTKAQIVEIRPFAQM